MCRVIIFFYFLLSLGRAIGCTMFFEPPEKFKTLVEVKKDFSKSGGIFTGFEKDGILYNEFKIEKKWTPLIDKFSTGKRSTNCEDFTSYLENGERYLLIFASDIKTSKDHELVDYTNAIIIKLSEAETYIDKLAQLKNIPDNAPNPSWQYCKIDKDCVADKGICGESIGVNKKYQAEYKGFINRSPLPSYCFIKKIWDSQSNPTKCIHNFCGE